MKPHVLVVDDERKIRLILKRLLEGRGYEADLADDGDGALEAVSAQPPDLILLDLKMPGRGGLETLRELRAGGYEGGVIMMTAYGTIASAVEAMRSGAYDYITKPFSNEELLLVVERALEHDRLRRDLSFARRQLEDQYSVRGIVAASRGMLDLLGAVKRIAPTDAPALVVGESGTGKELIAKAIHQESRRRKRPFVAIKCGALPANLVESELFGYRRGAFTGADRTKPGLVAQADGGTLFLDEIAELGPEAQTKLLRFTQSGEFIPLGGTEPKRVDARLLAASNRDLEEAVAEGTFRADLFYRLNVVMLRIPSLRERREDIPLLVEHFLRLHASAYGKESYRFDGEALDALRQHDWPGNVRELENAIKSALVMADSSPMGPQLLPTGLSAPHATIAEIDLSQPLREMLSRQQQALEREAIRQALTKTGGNRTRAAERLGISRVTLLRKLKQYGIA